MTDRILRVTDLRKSFNGIVAADGITFSVDRGEFHGLIGPNGSGKTTLFDLITGFLDADDGSVWFDGEEITGLSPDAIARRGLCRTFQLTAPFEELTVRRNLLATYDGGLRAGLRISADERERANELLERLELEDIAEHRAGEISGGQQKLLELGRVLMLEPKCLLLDEPTAGVNPSTQARILNLLRAVNAEGTTVVLIEHDMSVVADVAERITVLDRGAIVTRGAFADVTADASLHEAFLGPDSTTLSEAGASTSMVASSSVAGLTTQSPGRTADPGSRSLARADPAHPAHQRHPLVATDVVTGYGAHRVVDGVTIRTRPGLTCLFGPNGSGKSTLLKALAGVLPTWSGTIRYGQRPLTGRDSREFIEAGIAMVPQRDMIFEGLSVRENLQLGAAAVPTDRPVPERIESVVDAFPAIESRFDDRAGDLSGGEQTMVGIARAMVTDSDIYLLDEPTSSLSPAVTEDVFEMVEALVDGGAQVILAEQNVRQSLEIADHVYLLVGGTVSFDGPPTDLRDESDLLQRYLGID